jgi:hypothetical protein
MPPHDRLRRSTWTHRAIASIARGLGPGLALAALAAGCAGLARLPVDVISWARGPEQLTPGARGDRRLLLLQTSQPLASATPVLRACLPAQSFLPAPADSRLFFLVGGRLHVRRAPGEDPVLLPGSAPDLGVAHLLAFTKHASPLEMLVSAKPTGASSWQLWLLVVEDQGIQSARPVTMDPGLASKEAFFAAYTAPRCLDGGRRCLVPRWDGQNGFLEEEASRDGSSKTIERTGGVEITDAAWASPDGTSLYVLLPCR